MRLVASMMTRGLGSTRGSRRLRGRISSDCHLEGAFEGLDARSRQHASCMLQYPRMRPKTAQEESCTRDFRHGRTYYDSCARVGKARHSGHENTLTSPKESVMQKPYVNGNGPSSSAAAGCLRCRRHERTRVAASTLYNPFPYSRALARFHPALNATWP